MKIEIVRCWIEYKRLGLGIQYNSTDYLFMVLSVGLIEIWVWRN